MILDLNDKFDRRKFLARVRTLLQNRKRVELKSMSEAPLSQYKYLHLLIGYVASVTGNELEYVKREWFKRQCNSQLFLDYFNDPLYGRTERLKSIKELTDEELFLATERFKNWGAKLGLYLPEKENREEIQAAQKELYNDRFHL